MDNSNTNGDFIPEIDQSAIKDLSGQTFAPVETLGLGQNEVNLSQMLGSTAPLKEKFHIPESVPLAQVADSSPAQQRAVTTRIVVKPCHSSVTGKDIMQEGAKFTLSIMQPKPGRYDVGCLLAEVKTHYPSMWPLMTKIKDGNLMWDDVFMKGYTFALPDRGLTIADLDDESRLQIHLLKNSRFVGTSKIPANTLQRFYLYDEAEAATATLSKRELKRKANAMLDQLTSVEHMEMAVLYGGDSRSLTPTLALARLDEEVERNPQTFIQYMENRERTGIRTKIKLMMQYGVLQLRDGRYMFDQHMLGHSEEATVEYLSDVRNQPVYIQLRQKLDAARKTA